MRKYTAWLLAAIIVFTATATTSLAASSYDLRIDKTSYNQGEIMTIVITAPTSDWYTVEIIKGSETLMSLPESEISITMEIMIPLEWVDGTDYVLRVGRGSDIASLNFEISSKPVSAVYALSVDKSTVNVGDILILSGTSNIANSVVQYFVSASGDSFTQKTGDVVIANNRFECFIDIDSSYAAGMYNVRIGGNNVFSNDCTFSVAAAQKVAGIIASPQSSTVTAGTLVTLSTATPNAVIYYTLNGTTPTESSTLYTNSGITINSTTTLKAIAVRAGYENSDIMTQVYTVGGGGPGGGGGGSPGNDVNDDDEVKDDADDADEEQGVDEGIINPFTDVAEGAWYYDDVLWAYANGLMNGTAPDAFSPGLNLTRAMLVTILYRYAGEPDTDQASLAPFVDTNSDAYYYNAVLWAAQNGIVGGYGNGIFGPNDPIKRQDLAVILMRYMDYKEIVLPVTLQWIFFTDEADISDYAMNALQTLNKLGVINGIGNNVINPKGDATRAEAAAMLHRFAKLLEP